MKIFQTYTLNYILIILLTFAASWYFISNDKNKLVSASKKSIESVVTISSSNNLLKTREKNGIGSGAVSYTHLTLPTNREV